MDLKKINKFIKWMDVYSDHGSKQIIKVDEQFKPVDTKCSYLDPIKPGQIILSINDTVYIVYDEKLNHMIICKFKSSPGYIQSKYYLSSMDQPIMQYLKHYINLLDENKFFKNYLILGLGIGTMPNYLISKAVSKGLVDNIERIDCVDTNSILTKLYKTFLSISDRIHVYNTTGFDFVSTTSNKYDCVFIDIPCEFVTYELMGWVHLITSKSRKVFLNLIDQGIDQLDPNVLFDKFTIQYYKATNHSDPLKVNHLYLLS